MEEYFEIVNEDNQVIGKEPRRRCHGDPTLVHRAVHVVIFHPENDHILLQKRSALKDVQPGRWDTAVGGHLNVGEDYLAAGKREMLEELGIEHQHPLIYLFDSKIRNNIESENIRTFGYMYGGPFTLQASEVDEVRFFSREELMKIVRDDDDRFTPNLKTELHTLLFTRLPDNIA